MGSASRRRADERERLRRHAVQPLRVVDHADERPLVGGAREQVEDGEPDQEPIRDRTDTQPERRAEGLALRLGQPIEADRGAARRAGGGRRKPAPSPTRRPIPESRGSRQRGRPRTPEGRSFRCRADPEAPAHRSSLHERRRRADPGRRTQRGGHGVVVSARSSSSHPPWPVVLSGPDCSASRTPPPGCPKPTSDRSARTSRYAPTSGSDAHPTMTGMLTARTGDWPAVKG